MEILQVKADVLHADRRTDTTMLIVTFRNFANAHENVGLEISTKVHPYICWNKSTEQETLTQSTLVS
jgi:hypothetical protein